MSRERVEPLTEQELEGLTAAGHQPWRVEVPDVLAERLRLVLAEVRGHRRMLTLPAPDVSLILRQVSESPMVCSYRPALAAWYMATVHQLVAEVVRVRRERMRLTELELEALGAVPEAASPAVVRRLVAELLELRRGRCTCGTFTSPLVRPGPQTVGPVCPIHPPL